MRIRFRLWRHETKARIARFFAKRLLTVAKWLMRLAYRLDPYQQPVNKAGERHIWHSSNRNPWH